MGQRESGMSGERCEGARRAHGKASLASFAADRALLPASLTSCVTSNANALPTTTCQGPARAARGRGREEAEAAAAASERQAAAAASSLRASPLLALAHRCTSCPAPP